MILIISIYLAAQEELVSVEAQSAAAGARGGKTLHVLFYSLFSGKLAGLKIICIKP